MSRWTELMEGIWWRTSANVRRERVPYWGDSGIEVTGKFCADSRNQQSPQIQSL